jgi:hypothetical protein
MARTGNCTACRYKREFHLSSFRYHLLSPDYSCLLAQLQEEVWQTDSGPPSPSSERKLVSFRELYLSETRGESTYPSEHPTMCLNLRTLTSAGDD